VVTCRSTFATFLLRFWLHLGAILAGILAGKLEEEKHSSSLISQDVRGEVKGRGKTPLPSFNSSTHTSPIHPYMRLSSDEGSQDSIQLSPQFDVLFDRHATAAYVDTILLSLFFLLPNTLRLFIHDNEIENEIMSFALDRPKIEV
jgi:hypothetical protein